MLFAQISVISLIVLLCNIVTEAIELEGDADTIVIEASSSDDSDFRQEKQFGQFGGQFGLPVGWPFQVLGIHYPILQIQHPQRPPQPTTCSTPRGDQGQCVSLRQCYPALRTIGENETLLNPGLADALRSVSGSCQNITPKQHNYYRSEIEELQRQGSVCCSSQRPHPPLRDLATTTTTTTTTEIPSRNNYRPPFFGHRPPAPPSTTLPPSFVPSNCGVGHITGGSETEPSKYPWVVALLNGQKQICGGSLIDNNHVLTAAHCIAHMNPYDVARLRVLLGAHNIHQVSTGTVVKKVARIVKHRFFSHRTLHNDIAILRLESAASFTDRIRPICLTTDTNNRYENRVATVAGWGSVGEHASQPQSLREVAIDIWTNDQCKTKYGALAPGGIQDHMLCAGSNDRDACRGDSGGPLMIQSDSVFKQIGIVSWGIGCGRFPGVYTRITHFLDWIDKNRQ